MRPGVGREQRMLIRLMVFYQNGKITFPFLGKSDMLPP